jgi:hypothetical protein
LELLPLTTVERDERAAGEAEPVGGIRQNDCTGEYPSWRGKTIHGAATAI